MEKIEFSFTDLGKIVKIKNTPRLWGTVIDYDHRLKTITCEFPYGCRTIKIEEIEKIL